MTDDLARRLREIRERLEAATPGPWRGARGIVVADMPRKDYKTTAVAYCGDEFRHAGGLPSGAERDGNIGLIAHAPSDISFLLDALEAKDAEIAKLYEKIDLLEDTIDGLRYEQE